MGEGTDVVIIISYDPSYTPPSSTTAGPATATATTTGWSIST
jgi:hypothetical protein